MEKMESALDVLSRAATMVQPCPPYPASDSDGFETPSTGSSGESECDRTLSPVAPRPPPAREGGKWKRERRNRLPDYKPRESGKMALRSQSFHERRPAAAPRAAPHSDGELSDGVDDRNARERATDSSKGEAPLDMCLRSRQPPPPPPPYARPSVIKTNDTPPGSMSMCDPVIDEHFRRSLGDDYMTLFKKHGQPEPAAPGPKPNTKDRASSPIQFENKETTRKIIAMEVDDASLSVDDHFAKALGDTWKQIQTSRLKEADPPPSKVVDDHFSKALGDTWSKLQAAKPRDADQRKDQATKIITRSGVVI